MSRYHRSLRRLFAGLALLAIIGLSYKAGQRSSLPSAQHELREERKELSVPAVMATITKQESVPAAGLQFAVLGDTRDGERTFAAELTEASRHGARFAIVLGDLVSSGRASEYVRVAELLEAAPLPVLVVPGNHDYLHSGKSFYRDLFGPGDYSFDAAGYRFIMLDNAEGRLTAPQLQGLKGELQTKLPKLVFLHIPPNTFPRWSWHSFSQGALPFVLLMDRYRPAVVFMSHIHAYDRADRHGVEYTVTGGGGAPLVSKLGPNTAFHHFLLVTAGPKGVTSRVVRMPEK